MGLIPAVLLKLSRNLWAPGHVSLSVPFLVCWEQTSTSMTFPGFQRTELTVVNQGVSQVASVVKSIPTNADSGYTGSIPRSGKPPGVGNCNWLQYSCLENSTKEV